MESFAVILRKERESRGLTQQELADEVGINLRTYQKYELRSKWHNEPKQDILAKLAFALKVNVGYLLGVEKKISD